MSINEALNEALRWRYATKKFDPNRRVDESVIVSILESANFAASSYGLQPYQLILVQDHEVREELVACSYGQRQVADASHLIVIAIRTDVDETFVRRFIELKETKRELTPGSLAKYGEMMAQSIVGMSPMDRLNWAARQAYIVMGTLLTACAIQQIDSCPMEGFVPEAYDQTLNLAAYNLHAQLLLPIGFRSPDDETQYLAKVRRPLAETVMRF